MDCRIEREFVEGASLGPLTPFPSEVTYAVEGRNGFLSRHGEGRPRFTFLVQDEKHWYRLLRAGIYSVAVAFVKAEFEVDGDLVEAVKFYSRQPRNVARNALAALRANLNSWFAGRQSGNEAANNIRFHYDRSHEFYRQFLDSRLVYSCAYFNRSGCGLDEAQLAKLDHICRKLRLQRDEGFLDIGCGWGALVLHGAARYGVQATGCTLSPAQLLYAKDRSLQLDLLNSVRFLERDYRALSGKFDKIASVGMFEHVGASNIDGYFATVAKLLSDGGLFLNHGIVRPTTVKTDPETLFLQRRVFPGGALVRLSDEIQSGEKAGFEVLDVENLRPHYGLTCRAWVKRLIENRESCLREVDFETYRTWLLYLAASAASFESGQTEVHQVLFAKRGKKRSQPLTRDYIYSNPGSLNARSAN